VATATRFLVPVLIEWEAHEFRCWRRGLRDEERRADASATHTRIAEQLRDLALRQGGIYVKARPL